MQTQDHILGGRTMQVPRALLALLLLSWPAQAAELPSTVLPQGVGVNIHFTRGHDKDLDRIAAAGFTVVRMDFAWGGIERKKGEYDWSAYDELTAGLEKRGLRPMYILDYSNRLYEEVVVTKNPINGRELRDVASPRHPESVAAFARWAAAAARRYRGRHVIWEVWNEPNITFWKPKPDVKEYTALALATCKAVREADPQATVVAPATSGVPLEFLDRFFASGVLAHLDAVSVHPYRPYHRPPETAAEDYARLRKLIEKHAPPGKKQLPILSGEWGYASHTRGVSPQTQAAYLARQQLANLLHGVPLSVWYDWKDDGPDPAEREHNFGTVRPDLTPKPAYRAAQVLTRELAGYRVVRRLEAGSEKDFVLLLANAAGRRKLAAWTLGGPHAVTLAGLEPGGKVTGSTLSGEPFTPKVTGKELVHDLDAAPKYVTLEGGPR
jgi:polysaccharide biosynthesis protein PslG